MAVNLHTRLYGNLTRPRVWLAACIKMGIKPDIIFTLGRDYVVATSDDGDVFMKRGPRGPLASTRIPELFSKSLRRNARRELRRRMHTVEDDAKMIKWRFRLPKEKTPPVVS